MTRSTIYLAGKSLSILLSFEELVIKISGVTKYYDIRVATTDQQLIDEVNSSTQLVIVIVNYNTWFSSDFRNSINNIKQKSPRTYIIVLSDEKSIGKFIEEEISQVKFVFITPISNEEFKNFEWAIYKCLDIPQAEQIYSFEEKPKREHVAQALPSLSTLAGLRRLIDGKCSDSDIRTICFDMEVDYETIKGDGKSDTIVKLLSFCKQHSRIEELLQTIAAIRTDLKDDLRRIAPDSTLT